VFDTFPSREQTPPANPGHHLGVPGFELDSSERFFTGHLGQGTTVTAAADRH
jgi:hypothetical protein